MSRKRIHKPNNARPRVVQPLVNEKAEPRPATCTLMQRLHVYAQTECPGCSKELAINIDAESVQRVTMGQSIGARCAACGQRIDMSRPVVVRP